MAVIDATSVMASGQIPGVTIKSAGVNPVAPPSLEKDSAEFMKLLTGEPVKPDPEKKITQLLHQTSVAMNKKINSIKGQDETPEAMIKRQKEAAEFQVGFDFGAKVVNYCSQCVNKLDSMS